MSHPGRGTHQLIEPKAMQSIACRVWNSAIVLLLLMPRPGTGIQLATYFTSSHAPLNAAQLAGEQNRRLLKAPTQSCTKVVATEQQCGGTMMWDVPEGAVAVDSLWPGFCCKPGYRCQRFDTGFEDLLGTAWFCLPPGCTVMTLPSQQCGGQLGTTLVDGAWTGYCCLSGTRCTRQSRQKWSCQHAAPPAAPSPVSPRKASPARSPPRPSPTPSPMPESEDKRCGVQAGRKFKCPQLGCCSRWSWCGQTSDYCDPRKGCQPSYGRCSNQSATPTPDVKVPTDARICGVGRASRCMTGFCCNKNSLCTSAKSSKECHPKNGCQQGYGMCYTSRDDLQYQIDVRLADAGKPAGRFKSNTASNATLLSLFAFSVDRLLPGATTTTVCGQPGTPDNTLQSPCMVHVVAAGETVASIAAKYGTNTYQLLAANPLMTLPMDGKVEYLEVRPSDILAVRPPPGQEIVRWGWTSQSALRLGDLSYPRPCSGYSTQDQRMACYCHYHEDGLYVWPFSSGNSKCRERIQCVNGQVEGRTLLQCPAGTVADDVEYTGEATCAPQPPGYECSTGDGCTSMDCFCREFLLRNGLYPNPFDSTLSTAIECHHTEPGWFKGMLDCDGGFYNPYTQNCTETPKIPLNYRRGYTSCDGVPNPDANPATSKPSTGKKLLWQRSPWPPSRGAVAACSRWDCCNTKRKAAALRVGCVANCAKGKCVDGANRLEHVPARAVKGSPSCVCVFRGRCPTWFNKGCKYRK